MKRLTLPITDLQICNYLELKVDNNLLTTFIELGWSPTYKSQ
jgi:hypothetical protein